MAAFCGKCGAPLTEGSAFCGACGAQVVQAAVPPQPAAPPPPAPSPWGQPAAQPAPSAWGQQPPSPPPPPPSPWGQQPPPAASAPNPYAAAPAKKGGGMKVLLIVLGVLFVGAVIVVGGIVWEVHRVVNKVKTAAADAGLSSDDMKSMGNVQQLDACKYLTASDVSDAVGVPIIEARTDIAGCHYIAKGSASNFTAGHIAARGDGKPPVEATDSDSTETTSLVNVSVSSGGGRTQMKLQKALLGGLGIAGAKSNLRGIGDEAMVIGNNLLIARKGDMLIQITYTNCPCSATQIEPLAKKLVDAL